MMKISGPEKIILTLTAAFLLFTGGHFLGARGSGEPYAVDGQTVRTADVGESAAASAVPGVININTAGVELLQTLPGIGLVRAQNIVSDRQANGPFRIPEDLLRVSGIGEGTLHEILNDITVN